MRKKLLKRREKIREGRKEGEGKNLKIEDKKSKLGNREMKEETHRQKERIREVRKGK